MLQAGQVRRFGIFLVGLGLALAALMAHVAAWADEVQLLTTADAQLAPAGLPARHEAALDLSDGRNRWDALFPGHDGRASYRLTLPAGAAGEPQGLWLERVGNQFRLWVNGVELQGFGTLGEPEIDAVKLGHLVVIPAGLLRTDAPNALRVDVSMQALRAGGLWPVRFGPVAELRALQSRQYNLVRSTSAAYLVSLLLMGGVAAGLWWRQRDALYGCFSLTALLGTVRHVNAVSLDAPLPWPLWGAVMAIGYGAHLALVARLVLLLVDRSPPWLVRSIYAMLGGVVLAAAASFAWGRPGLWTAALYLMESVGIVCFGVVLGEARRTRRMQHWLVLAAGTLLLIAAAHDIAFVRQARGGGLGYPLTPHAMFLMVLILAGLVVARYNRSVAEHRALHDELAQRVAEREQQLNEAFEALRAQQAAQVVSEERQRMMREIHDGIGAQLVGLLGMVSQPQPDRGALEEQVKLALDEMRIAVDSLQPSYADLTAVLATLRYRLEPRLQAAGLRIVWDVPQLPETPGLGAPAFLHFHRILLEAFTNVLKHARASRVTVRARWEQRETPWVQISVIDDGVGLPASADPQRRGQGLASMKARAEAIGAALQWSPAPGGGTCLCLEWPLPSPPQATAESADAQAFRPD
jgi:signal transduction histidine kinase